MDTNNVANFFDYKRRWNIQVIYVGDIVEWQDYDGKLFEGKVTKIQHKPLEGFTFAETVDCLPLWEKEDYVVHLEDGISVIGECVVRKIIRLAKDRVKNKVRTSQAH